MGEADAEGQITGLSRPWERPGPRLILAAALVLAVAASSFFLVYVPSERREAVAAWEARLTDVADDRKVAVTGWLDDAFADAHAVGSLPSVRAAIASRTARNSAPAIPDALQTFLRAHGYLGVTVLGADGSTLLAWEAPLSPEARSLAVAALAAGAPLAEILEGKGRKPVAVFAAPTPERGNGAGVALLVDPTRWLYPLLAREAVPTRTGETILVRKEAGDVLFLCPLRKRPGPPLSLRLPAIGPTIAARIATTGKEVVGEFLDYSGAPVVASARPVSGTRWSLIAKVDRDEALGPFRGKMRIAGILLGLSIAVVAVLAVALAREAGDRFRKAAEASRLRLALLLEEANDAILYFGEDGRILEANRGAEELYGYSRAEMLSLSLHDLSLPQTAEASRDRQAEPATGRTRPVFEARHRRKDGAVISVEVSDSATTIGGAPGFVSIVRDMSARKEAERRITFLNSILRTLSEVNQLIVRERDHWRLLDGVCRAAVDYAGIRMAWVGYADRESGVVRPVAIAGYEEGYLSEIVVRCDDSPEGRGPAGTSIREGITVTLDDMTGDPRFGPWRAAASRRGYRSSASLPLRVEGEVIGALTVYSDEPRAFQGEIVDVLEEMAADLGFALESRRKEAALRRSESLYRLIAENTADVIWTFDVASRQFTYVGPSVERLRGFTAAEAMTQPPESAFAPESRGLLAEELRERIASVAAGDESARTRTSLVGQLHRDGRTVPTETVTTLLGDGEGRVAAVLGVSRDVTERRRHEEELLRLNDELERRVRERTAELQRANDDLEEFSSSVSHDLRAPLRAIDGYSGMLERACGERLDEREARLLAVVRESAARMARLIDDLLAFSRARRTEIHGSPVDMRTMARRAFEEITSEETRGRIAFTVGDLPEAWGDASLLKQVWINLLSNAVKFSKGRERPVLEVTGAVEGDSAVYRVRDNGAGFDMAYAGRLFGVFQRLHGAEEFEGTGVGLALVKRIVTRHGGDVAARGAPGEGATFSFSLPLDAGRASRGKESPVSS